MDQATVIDKIKKCLNLARCSTADEAAQAAYTAQKLIARYGIDEALLLTEKTELPADEAIIENTVFKFDGPRVVTWVLNLGSALAEVNNCKLWFSAGRCSGHATIKAAGREQDVATISYMMAYLSKEIEEISKDKAREFRDDHGFAGGKTWTNSFKTGAVSMVRERLVEARDQAIKDARASAVDVRDKVVSTQEMPKSGETPVVKYELAVIDNAIELWSNRKKRAEEWAEQQHKFYTSHRRPSSYNGNAWQSGRDAGAKISLTANPRITG